MMSSESTVQVCAGIVGLVVLSVGASLLDLSIWWTQPLLVGLFEAIVFEGGHLYLVFRGGGGSVTLTARGRFVLLIAAFLLLVPLIVLLEGVRVGSVAARRVLMWLLDGIALWYLVLEGVAGYRATMAGNRASVMVFPGVRYYRLSTISLPVLYY